MRLRNWHLVVAILGLCAVWIAVRAWVIFGPPSKSPRPITIAKDTTYITEPLTADGYPDYLAALNERLSRGVTPENNGVVPFFQAVGPRAVSDNLRGEFFRLLGIPPLLENGDYYVQPEKFADRLPLQTGPQGTAKNPVDEIYDQVERACLRPWTREDFPVLVEWLHANERPLTKVIDALRRKTWYVPRVSDRGPFNPFGTRPIDHRRVPESLRARSMLKLSSGDVEGACQDAIACHQLARRLAEGQMLIDAIVALTIEMGACETTASLLHFGRLDAVAIERLRSDWLQLPNVTHYSDELLLTERLDFLGAIVAIAHGDMPFSGLTSIAGARKETTWEQVLRRTANYDEALQTVNVWFDRLAATCVMPQSAARDAAFQRLAADANALAQSLPDRQLVLAGLMPVDAFQDPVGRYFGEVVVRLMMPSEIRFLQLDRKLLAYHHMLDMAFALAAYRAEEGAYPNDLASLVPKYLAELPVEPFTHAATGWRYQTKDDGYLIYSVGENGTDNGGQTEGNGDDLTIRTGEAALEKQSEERKPADSPSAKRPSESEPRASASDNAGRVSADAAVLRTTTLMDSKSGQSLAYVRGSEGRHNPTKLDDLCGLLRDNKTSFVAASGAPLGAPPKVATFVGGTFTKVETFVVSLEPEEGTPL